MIRRETSKIVRSSMNDEDEKLPRCETELIAEISRLRALLRQVGIDAQRSSNETAAADLRHARNMEAERAETRAARADADELRHRLKNALAVVQTIANATFRPDTPLDEARQAFNARLDALAQAHDMLFESSWTNANLMSVIESSLGPYIQAGPHRVRARGPNVDLGAKPALALALAFHELATNAAKYGALSNDAGYVEIAWTLAPVAEGRELRLRWHERNGPPVVPPSREGFGSRLIKSNLAAEFNGSVELAFQPDGLAFTICALAQQLH
jgi:two-component sensor histidine kinase